MRDRNVKYHRAGLYAKYCTQTGYLILTKVMPSKDAHKSNVNSHDYLWVLITEKQHLLYDDNTIKSIPRLREDLIEDDSITCEVCNKKIDTESDEYVYHDVPDFYFCKSCDDACS